MLTSLIPGDRTTEKLASIWARVLGRSPIVMDDNFFELGGDPKSANLLFSEIANEFARELSPLTIYHAPTLAQLAAVLENPDPPPFSALVPLRRGTNSRPIFLIPGLGGTVMEFFQLVQHMDANNPIYGLQSPGMDGIQEPFDRVEDLAAFYLDAVRRIQPRGPYLFVGYSLGGLVALEMAQRLTTEGEKIALLVLVESYPHRSHLPVRQHGIIAWRLAKRLVLKTLRRMGIPLRDPQDRGSEEPDEPEVGPTFKPVMDKAIATAYLSWQRYRPRYYKGRIHFIKRTELESKFADDPVAVWSKLTDGLTVRKIQGGHLGVISIHFRTLAAVLSEHLRDAPRENDRTAEEEAAPSVM